MFSQDFDWKSFGIDTGYNVMWNFADIYMELADASDAMGEQDYYRFGENVGKIITDTFVKNPLDVSWNLNNSNVFMAENPPSDILST